MVISSNALLSQTSTSLPSVLPITLRIGAATGQLGGFRLPMPPQTRAARRLPAVPILLQHQVKTAASSASRWAPAPRTPMWREESSDIGVSLVVPPSVGTADSVSTSP